MRRAAGVLWLRAPCRRARLDLGDGPRYPASIRMLAKKSASATWA